MTKNKTSKLRKVSFPKSKIVGKRNWGKEILLALVEKKFSLKLLVMKKGSMGGLQYHHKKNECGYILSGKLQVRYDDGKGKLKKKILKPGGIFHFPPKAVHQELALTNCKIIEVSTPYFNDRVRVEEKYGLEINGGLPTTNFKDVLHK